MAGDVLKKVKSGDPLRIPAQTFNTFIDVAKDFNSRKMCGGQFAQREFSPSGVVLVKNNSGSDCDRFNVLGIDGLVFTPTDSLESFKNKVAFKGVTPSQAAHIGKFVILQEPIKAGEIGSAWITGFCPVQVDMINANHRFADIADGDSAALRSSSAGAAQILWVESGTGIKWAAVQIGLPAGNRSFIAHITNQGPNAEPDYTDERYWVQSLNITNSDPTARLTFSWGSSSLYHVTATHLDELNDANHSLPVDRSVKVVVFEDIASYYGTRCYYFMGPNIVVN